MNTITFHHGGRHGDLIFALWTVRELCERYSSLADLKLSPYHSPGWGLKEIDSMVSFLETQPYIRSVSTFDLPKSFWERPLDKRDGIDFDLHAPERIVNPNDFPYWDKRSWPGNVNLAERTAKYFSLDYNPDQHWIYSPGSKTKFDLCVHYPARRGTRSLDEVSRVIHRLAKDGLKIGLLGRPEDKSWLQIESPNIKDVQTENYLELSKTVRSSNVFFGCASSPLALACGLKVKRFADLQDHCRNVLPLGEGGLETTVLDEKTLTLKLLQANHS